jgi:hypothetical protein
VLKALRHAPPYLLVQIPVPGIRRYDMAIKKSATKKTANPPGIGRSAITGRFMSVSAAKAHKKTAIVEGAGKKKRK